MPQHLAEFPREARTTWKASESAMHPWCPAYVHPRRALLTARVSLIQVGERTPHLDEGEGDSGVRRKAAENHAVMAWSP